MLCTISNAALTLVSRNGFVRMRSLAGDLSIDFSRRCGPRDHKSKKVRSTKRLHRRLSYPRRAGDDVVDLQLGYDGVAPKKPLKRIFTRRLDGNAASTLSLSEIPARFRLL